MSDQMNIQEQHLHKEPEPRQEDLQAPVRTQQGAVAQVASYLRGRPAAPEMGQMLQQMRAQGRLGRGEMMQVRNLLQRQCGNDYAREAFTAASAAGPGGAAASVMGADPALKGPEPEGPEPEGPVPGGPEIEGPEPEGPTAPTSRPVTLQEHRDAGTVRRDFMPGQRCAALRRALDRVFEDKEAIYRLLEDCNRTEAGFIERTYRKVFGRDLLEHLDDKMGGAALRRAYAPFGRASEVSETTGEWIARKTGQVVDTAKKVYKAEKEGIEVALDMLSIVKDLGLNPLTGEGTVTLDVGKAFFYLAPYLPPHLAYMFNLDPSNSGAHRVTLYVNLKQKMASLHADLLSVRAMHYPNFFSGPCSLNKVDIQVRNFNPMQPARAGSTGFARIQGASIQTPSSPALPWIPRGPSRWSMPGRWSWAGSWSTRRACPSSRAAARQTAWSRTSHSARPG